jgi:anti-anti-sigma factor
MSLQATDFSGSSVRPSDVPLLALVRSWRECGGEVAWVQPVGELDIGTAPALEQALRGAELRARLVMLDLRELTFLDSCGVHVIVYASIRARRAGRRLVLVRGCSQVERVLALTGASEVLESVDLAPGDPAVQALLQLAQQKRSRTVTGPGRLA